MPPFFTSGFLLPQISCNSWFGVFYAQTVIRPFNPNRSLGLAWILLFRKMDFVWFLMSNSELLRIKNKQKAPYKKQKTASSYYNYTLNGLMTDLGSM
ncbi:hypothetical protein ST44_05305 [Prevotella pectinovora]|uniref:Uncharacterized protein n=1 Tax=Prevotella pectinovora TaxID=1602169 RepID=A0A0D0IWJ0_9BACT|nr:hypothetical protein ST44_05305 [Prevotella pectinovora]